MAERKKLSTKIFLLQNYVTHTTRETQQNRKKTDEKTIQPKWSGKNVILHGQQQAYTTLVQEQHHVLVRNHGFPEQQRVFEPVYLRVLLIV